jgi:hypothetical protein
MLYIMATIVAILDPCAATFQSTKLQNRTHCCINITTKVATDGILMVFAREYWQCLSLSPFVRIEAGRSIAMSQLSHVSKGFWPNANTGTVSSLQNHTNSSLTLWRWSDHGPEYICPTKLSKVNWNSNSKIDSVKFEWRRTHYVHPKINFDFKYQNSLTSTKNHEKCYGGTRKRTSWLIYPRSFISIGVFLPEKWRFATFF